VCFDLSPSCPPPVGRTRFVASDCSHDETWPSVSPKPPAKGVPFAIPFSIAPFKEPLVKSVSISAIRHSWEGRATSRPLTATMKRGPPGTPFDGARTERSRSAQGRPRTPAEKNPCPLFFGDSLTCSNRDFPFRKAGQCGFGDPNPGGGTRFRTPFENKKAHPAKAG